MTEESFGNLIKRKRQEHNISIDEICKKLNIKNSDFQLAEQDQWQILEKRLYIHGLISSIAKILQIDSETLKYYSKTLPIKSNTQNKKHQLVNIGENLDLSPDKKTFLNFSIASTLIFLIFLIIFNLISDKSDTLNHEVISQKLSKFSEEDNKEKTRNQRNITPIFTPIPLNNELNR